MKYVLLLLITGVCLQAQAINPQNPFYTPKKGNALLAGGIYWQRENDSTKTETQKQFAGMYGIGDSLALTATIQKQSDEVYGMGDIPTMPALGIRWTPVFDKTYTAVDVQYGSKVFSSDSKGYEFIDSQVIVGSIYEQATIGLMAGYRYEFGGEKNSILTKGGRTVALKYGVIGQYQATKKVSVDFAWTHFAKTRSRQKGGMIFRQTNPADIARFGITYAIKEKAFITPFMEYRWYDNTYASVREKRSDKKIGVILSVEI